MCRDLSTKRKIYLVATSIVKSQFVADQLKQGHRQLTYLLIAAGEDVAISHNTTLSEVLRFTAQH